jgi:hypothetical protein
VQGYIYVPTFGGFTAGSYVKVYKSDGTTVIGRFRVGKPG